MAISSKVLELMASRMCHDLVSPVGAIGNGLELMDDLGPGGGSDDAIALIRSSHRQAAARLQCFRLAYGSAGADPKLSAADAGVALSGWLSGTRTTADWQLAASGSLRTGLLKCALNTAMLAAECSPKSGVIVVARQGDGISVTVSGEGTGFRDGMREALEGQLAADQMDARKVHAFITGALIKAYGFVLTVDSGADGGLKFFIK